MSKEVEFSLILKELDVIYSLYKVVASKVKVSFNLEIGRAFLII